MVTTKFRTADARIQGTEQFDLILEDGFDAALLRRADSELFWLTEQERLHLELLGKHRPHAWDGFCERLCARAEAE